METWRLELVVLHPCLLQMMPALNSEPLSSKLALPVSWGNPRQVCWSFRYLMPQVGELWNNFPLWWGSCFALVPTRFAVYFHSYQPSNCSLLLEPRSWLGLFCRPALDGECLPLTLSHRFPLLCPAFHVSPHLIWPVATLWSAMWAASYAAI